MPELTWSEKQIQTLKDLYPTTRTRELCELIGKPYGAIKAKASLLGLLKTNWRSVWSEEETRLFLQLYPDTRSDVLATRFGKSLIQIYQKAARHKINKSAAFLSGPDSGMLQKGSTLGAATRFVKGQTPINKGKKQEEFMTKEGIERSKGTRFQKGQEIWNHQPVGSVQIRHSHKKRNGKPYKWIKTAEPKTWEMLHVHNWIKANGPIPDGFIVGFKSSDTMNCDPGNLFLLTREENMLRNTIHRYPDEVKTAIRTVSKLKKAIKKHEKHQ